MSDKPRFTSRQLEIWTFGGACGLMMGGGLAGAMSIEAGQHVTGALFFAAMLAGWYIAIELFSKRGQP